MAWYRTGAVSLTTGSNVVTGTGTGWKKNINGIGQGQALVANKTRVEIMYVDSDTQIRLAEPWSEPAYSGTYHIETAFAGTTGDSARQVMAALFLWKQMGVDWDEWLTSEAATVEVTNVFGEKVTIPTWKALSGASNLMAAVESITETLVTWKGNYSHKFKGGLSVGSSEYSGIELVQHTGRYTRIENTPHGAANFLTIVKREADGSTISSYSIPAGIGTAATQQWVNNRVQTNDNATWLTARNGWFAEVTASGKFRVGSNGGVDSFIITPNVRADFSGEMFCIGNASVWNKQKDARIALAVVDNKMYFSKYHSGTWKGETVIPDGDGIMATREWVQNTTGWGTSYGVPLPNKDFNAPTISGVYAGDGGTSLNPPTPEHSYGVLTHIQRYPTTHAAQISHYIDGMKYRYRQYADKAWQPWYDILTSNKYTIDGNGFYKKASPIITIGASRYTTNAESRGAVVRKVKEGEYMICGVLGYNDDGAWGVNGGISVPKDNNGLELVYVKDEVLPDGSIVIRIYHRQHGHLPETFQNNRKKPDGSFYADGEICDLPTYTRLDVRVGMPEDSVYNRRVRSDARYGALLGVIEAIQKVLSDKTLCLPAPAGI